MIIIFYIQRSWRKLPGVSLITEPTEKLAYCHVPKVASTAWMLSFAEMNLIPASSIKSMNKANSLHGYLYDSFSEKIQNPKEVTRLSKFYTITFIRHPFERLVSAFHDKFITIEQLNLMKPFIDFYINLNNIKKPNSYAWNNFPKKPKFNTQCSFYLIFR